MMDKNVIVLIFKDLLHPAKAILYRRHAFHFTIIKQFQIAFGIATDNYVKFIHFTKCFINHINMAGVDRVKFPKNHTHFFIVFVRHNVSFAKSPPHSGSIALFYAIFVQIKTFFIE